MTKMTGKLRQRMLESFEKSMAQVFAGGLRVVAERINGKSVVVRLFVTDDKGAPIIEIGSAEMAEGDSLTATGIKEALRISLE
jgi:hypothetical protein